MVWAGPSPRPSCAFALCFKATKVTRNALARKFGAIEGRRKRQALAGRAARAETFRAQDACSLFSPANCPARNSDEENPEQRRHPGLWPGPRRNTIALAFIDGLAAADKSQRGKKKAGDCDALRAAITG